MKNTFIFTINKPNLDPAFKTPYERKKQYSSIDSNNQVFSNKKKDPLMTSPFRQDQISPAKIQLRFPVPDPESLQKNIDPSYVRGLETIVENLKLKSEEHEREKINWLSFQSYFESQLSRFVTFTRTNDFSPFIYQDTSLIKKQIPIVSSQIGISQGEAIYKTRSTQNLRENSTTKNESFNQSTFIKLSEETNIPQNEYYIDISQTSYFTQKTLVSAKEQIKIFQEKINKIFRNQEQFQVKNTTQKNSTTRSISIEQNQFIPIFREINLYLDDICQIQVIYIFSKQQIVEENTIKRLKEENQQLQLQLLKQQQEIKFLDELTIRQQHLSYQKSQQTQKQTKHIQMKSSDLTNLEHQFKKQVSIANETNEEVEIYKLTAELLSTQLDYLKKQFDLAISENLKLKELNKYNQEVFHKQIQELNQDHQNSDLQNERTVCEQQQQIKLQNETIEKLKQQLDNTIQRPKADEEDLLTTEQNKYLIAQLKSDVLKYQIENSNLSKDFLKVKADKTLLKTQVDKLSGEKEKVQKSLIEQIQSLQSEKDSIADQYITQLNKISQKLNQSEDRLQQLKNLQEENNKLKQEFSEVQQQLANYKNMEMDMSVRKTSFQSKDVTIKNLQTEITKLKDELRQQNGTNDYRLNEQMKVHDGYKRLELQRDQLLSEVGEFQRQLQAKRKESLKPEKEPQKDQDFSLQEEIEKIYNQNKSKMIQMKSKLLGLKTNIEKHGEQLGVQAKQKNKVQKTPQEIAQEAQLQFSLIMDELYKLIDQMNDLQRAIDVDYGNKFTKINEKQRQLIQQNFQLRQDIKKYEGLDDYVRDKEKQIDTLKDSLKLITLEYKEYKDIMHTKFEDLSLRGVGSSNKLEITETDRNETARQKEITKLQSQVKDSESKVQMLKKEILNMQQEMQRQSQMPINIPPEFLHQLQMLNVQQMNSDEGMVHSVARSIAQNNLDVKQSDILNKKINDLSEKLSQKTLDNQRHLQENGTLKEQMRQEKQEWISQIEKKDKLFKVLEDKYKKCLQQFDDLQQKFFQYEENSNKQTRKQHSVRSSDSD